MLLYNSKKRILTYRTVLSIFVIGTRLWIYFMTFAVLSGGEMGEIFGVILIQ